MGKKEELVNLAATFVDTVRRLQKKAGINDAELSRAINLNPGTLSRLLSGETVDPRLSTLSALAKFFSVSISSLIGEAEQGFVPVFEQSKLQQAPIDMLAIGHNQLWIKPSKAYLSRFAIKLDKKAQLGPLPGNSILVIGNYNSLDAGDLVVLDKQPEPYMLAKIHSEAPLICHSVESTGKRQPFPIEESDIVGKVVEIILNR